MTKRRALYICLATVLAAMWIAPSTRETQLLCIRLLFRWAGDVWVQGQPESCSLEMVPNSQLSERAKQRVLAEATNSADAYIAATAATKWPKTSPSAEAWRGHPLLAWAAWKFTWGHHIQIRYGKTNDPMRCGVAAEQALGVVRIAQESMTNNGALWLAEACLQFDRRETNAALAALQEAVRRTNWTMLRRQTYSELVSRYRALGLSHVDAAIDVNRNEVEIPESLINAHLSDAMIGNVGYDERSRDFFMLAQQLRNVPWADPRYQARNKRQYSLGGSDFAEAVMKHRGITNSSRDEYSAKAKVQRELVLSNYFADLVGVDAARRHLDGAAAVQARTKHVREVEWDAEWKPTLRHVGFSLVGGAVSLFATGLFLVNGLLFIVSTALSKWVNLESSWLRRGAIPLPVAVLAGWLAYGAFNAFSAEVGLRTGGEPEGLPREAGDLIWATAVAGLWFGWALLRNRKRPPCAYIGCIYATVILFTTFERAQVVEMIAARFAFG